VWPHGADMAGRVLGGILTGRPGHGLPPRAAARVAPDRRYTGIAVCEALLGAVAGLGWWLGAGWYRPADARGGWPPVVRPPLFLAPAISARRGR